MRPGDAWLHPYLSANTRQKQPIPERAGHHPQRQAAVRRRPQRDPPQKGLLLQLLQGGDKPVAADH